MRVRYSLLMVVVATGLAACSSSTAPMECDGNPKCKADLQPMVPSGLRLEPAATAPTTGAAKLRQSRPS